jgi:periplasmic divalent cation tolerance protein
MAREAVDEHLAACVHIFPPIEAVYRWNGKIETGREIPMIFKIRASGFRRLAERFKERHPYACPGLVTLPIQDGLPGYLDWLVTETATRRPRR